MSACHLSRKAPSLLLFLLTSGVLSRTPTATAEDFVDIVITEVMYNPASGDRREDFIELHNIGTVPYDLDGFHFTSGLSFTFPPVILAPGEYLVLCADQTRIQQVYGITNTVGDWDPETTLDNGGERIKLVNAAGVEVEDFTYDDRNPWPILADGYGHSLERRSPFFDNDNPANWSASQVGGGWTRVTVTGLATSSRLYLYLLEAGTAYVDDVRMYPVGNPGDNRVVNGGFESGLTPWDANGSHSGSISSTERARTGARSLKVIATGPGASSGDSVLQDDLGLTDNAQYALEFYVYMTEPDQTIVARLSGSGGEPEPIYVEAGGGGATPGRQNSVYTLDLPPFVYPGAHSPQVPQASTPIRLLAVVEDDVEVSSVTAHWDSGAGEVTASMFDDGAHGDALAGDGLFGVEIGTFTTGSIVRYWFTATDDAAQEGRFPFAGNPTPVLGFYIQPSGINPTFQARSNTGLVSELPPVYHLLIDPAYLDGSATNPAPNSPHLLDPRVYRRGTFIFNGEVFDNVRIRHRGQSSLGRPKKHWKVDFNKDHRFLTPFEEHPEVDNINIQSCEGDKSFLREWLTYKAMMDAGHASLEMWHVRLYLNGVYRGLYVHLENPDDDWMDRTGLDAEGWLWKSYSQAQSGSTGGFEMEEDAGNAAAANAALGSFLSGVNSRSGASLISYINQNMDVETFIDFLAVHQLTHDADHPAKNYLVYADEDNPVGTWTYLLWDADLSHGRNFECSNCGLGSGVWNDCIRWDMWGDPQLLFGTTARPKCDGPWNGVINSFLLRTTEFRPAFYARTGELLEALYHPDVLLPVIDDMSAPLVSEVALDWQRNPPTYGRRNSPVDYPFHVEELRRWVNQRYAYLSSALAELTAPEIDNLACQRSGDNALISWRNNAVYEQIRVYRNEVLARTLSGSATNTSVPLDLGSALNSFRVSSVVDGVERGGRSCTIIISTGGYTQVINEDFSPPAPSSELQVNCNATQTLGALQLTEATGDQAGSAFFLNPFPNGDFIADFDIRFDDPSDPGADGMAFIINTGSQTDICGAAGGGMGYLDGDGGNPVFPGYAVVFDTWENPGEPSHNWVGFVDTAAGSFPVEAVNVPEEFNGSGTFHCKLLAQEGTFSLLMSNSGIGMGEREIFSHTVPGFTERNVYFGFSAGTGGAFARHTMDNFVLQINTGAEPVVADFTADVRNGGVPLRVRFTSTSTNADSWSWDFGDGDTASIENPSHDYTEPGTYTVTLVVSGPGGTDTMTKVGYIVVTQEVTAEFVATPNLGALPLTVQFENQSTGAVSYEWDFGDGETSNEVHPEHTYVTAGQHTVTLTAVGDGGTEDTRTRIGYVQVDGEIRAGFVADVTSGPAPLTVRFTDQSTGETITSRLWNFGDGTTSTVESPVHVYENDGVYTVGLQVFGFAIIDNEQKTGYIRVGSSAGSFVRGNSNRDAEVDISDAVFTLNWLFLGGEAPPCLDAADADDSGAVDITDPILVLGYLFQGGPPPPAPHPDPGPDPTPDGLGDC